MSNAIATHQSVWQKILMTRLRNSIRQGIAIEWYLEKLTHAYAQLDEKAKESICRIVHNLLVADELPTSAEVDFLRFREAVNPTEGIWSQAVTNLAKSENLRMISIEDHLQEFTELQSNQRRLYPWEMGLVVFLKRLRATRNPSYTTVKLAYYGTWDRDQEIALMLENPSHTREILLRELEVKESNGNEFDSELNTNVMNWSFSELHMTCSVTPRLNRDKDAWYLADDKPDYAESLKLCRARSINLRLYDKITLLDANAISYSSDTLPANLRLRAKCLGDIGYFYSSPLYIGIRG